MDALEREEVTFGRGSKEAKKQRKSRRGLARNL
jgi:hypothetical protein